MARQDDLNDSVEPSSERTDSLGTSSSIWMAAGSSSAVSSQFAVTAAVEDMQTFFMESGSSFSASLANLSSHNKRGRNDVNHTFFLSRSTSVATSFRSRGTGAADTIGSKSFASNSAAYQRSRQQRRRQRLQQRKLKQLRLGSRQNATSEMPTEQNEREQRGPHGLSVNPASTLNTDGDGLDDVDDVEGDPFEAYRDEDSAFLRLFDSYPHLLFEERPSSSFSHLRYCNRSLRSVPSTSSLHGDGADDLMLAPSSLAPVSMTKEVFEALPPKIKQKYFSTLERLRFNQSDGYHEYLDLPATDFLPRPQRRKPATAGFDKRIRRHKKRTASELATAALSAQPNLDLADRRFYASLPEKIKRLQLSKEEQRAARQRPASALLEAAERGFFAEPRYRVLLCESESHEPTGSRPRTAASDYTEGLAQVVTTMEPQELAAHPVGEKKTTNSMYDSFRWLEEDDDLDLRLSFDDYHINPQHEVPASTKSRRPPPFRRHLSMTKLPFARSSISVTRPSTKDTAPVPRSASAMGAPPQAPVGHVRRKSRTLSLMSPLSKPQQESVAALDTTAAHYRDPEARMKLREYLSSAQKFDEAIEFGFPALEDTSKKENKFQIDNMLEESAPDAFDRLCTFLDDDNSVYSDEGSATDLDSPKTPDLVEAHPQVQSLRVSPEPLQPSKVELVQPPVSSREMTLRMTLTRPDLRANEDDIYRWKMDGGSKTHVREMSVSPLPYARQGSSPKDAIERQFAAMDFEQATAQDGGVVKRFWNRVRRA